MKKSILPGCVFTLFSMLSLIGCEKKTGDAIVIGKDYVAAAKQGEETKDERATNHEQWIVKVRMRDTAVRSKFTLIECNGRNCAKTIESKPRIA